MTTQEREARLTAYALNDPSLAEADRLEIEAALRTDPASRQAVEETLRLAHLLTTGLAAEQAAVPLEKAVTIPSSLASQWSLNGWRVYASIAAVLLVAIGTYVAFDQVTRQRQREVAQTSTPKGTASYTDSTVPADGPATPATNDPAGLAELEHSTSAPTATRESYERAPRGDDAARTKPAADGRDGVSVHRAIPGASTTPPGFGGIPGGPAGTAGSGYGPGSGAAAGRGGSVGSPAGPGLSVPGGLPGPGRPGGSGAVAGLGAGAPGGTGPIPGFERRFGKSDRGTDPSTPGNPTPAKGATSSPDGGEVTEGRERLSPHDRYGSLIENSFTTVAGEAALSTFGVDVDTASYSIVRKYLGMNQMPPVDAIRLEEMVNYFRYQDKPPTGDDPFAVTVEVAECPWQPKHRLARIGLKAKPIASDKRPPSNLVFLIDVSGSMAPPNRLPLVKQSLRMLVNQLGENDRVAMVVYAGAAGLVLDSTPATQKEVILGALDRLDAGGSTNGAGGLQQAYDVAVANFIKNGTNRVILCTDGDWNVGTTSTEALVQLIEAKRKTGVFLSVFGFGMGNLRDEMMVKLAGKGNGNYAYIDTLKEANKALVEQMGGTLVTVAKDVKIQVEFNPATVQAYRLLGYEKRALAAKDFADDTKDAGEMGAGHVVTALYELVPSGLPTPVVKSGEELRYQKTEPAPKPSVRAGVAKEAFVVKMRHKKPDGDTSTLRELPVTDLGKTYGEASEDFRFAAAVASFSMLLRNSPYQGESSFALVHELADSARKYDPSGYRAEFIEMIKQARKLSGKE